MLLARIDFNIKDARANAHRDADVRLRQATPVFANLSLILGLAPLSAVVETTLLNRVTHFRARRHGEYFPAAIHVAERGSKHRIDFTGIALAVTFARWF